MYALPASDEHVELYRQCTGREAWPAEPFSEVTVIAGARSGKDSRIAAPVVLYEALFGRHADELHTGERAVVPLVAQDQRAARIAFTYIRDYLRRSSLLWGEVEEVLSSEMTMRNGVTIATFACTQRSLRGWSIPVGVLDEVGFYRLEGSTDSDVEVQTSIRRGMLGFASPKLLKISTPYLKSGVLWDDAQRFGQDDPDRLVWKASTALMNPSIAAARLARERRIDPRRYEREYEAEFVDDLQAFLAEAWVSAGVVEGRGDLPPQPGVFYRAAVDPSGGGPDTFAFAVGHNHGERLVVDCLRGWKAIGANLSAVVAEIAGILRTYECRAVTGDKYAAGWVRERFADTGIAYEESPRDKSAAYLELEPLLAQGRVELPDHPQLRRELHSLEKRALPGGRTRIDHPRGGHDDYANVVALLAMRERVLRFGIDSV
ncbi:MAG TPA: hypothetical protein VGK88_00845 [bacterium]|jgi:hypothetical protein